MLKSTLTTATSVFLLMSGAADLFAMESPDGDHDKALVTINHMPADIMKDIVTEATKDTNPRHLASVCKHWYSVMREDNIPQMSELHYSTMNPFMQEYMRTYWENLYYNGTLRYTPTDGSAAVTLKFSDFKDGTFDLSACGYTGKYLVITTSMDHFFKVGKENEDKTVVAIMLRHRIQQEIKDSPEHPFSLLMAGWDPDKAPVGMFWRWINNTVLSCYDPLTTAGVSKISSRNLCENWKVRYVSGPTQGGMGIVMSNEFHVCF